MIIVWVNNLIITASNHGVLSSVKIMQCKKRFQMMKDLGKLKHFLGVNFHQTEGKAKSERDMRIKFWRDLKCRIAGPEKLPVRPN